MTKVKSRQDLFKLLAIMGYGVLTGRSTIAPTRTTKWVASQVSDVPRAEKDGLECNGLELLVDSEPDRSHVIHNYPSICAIVEGRKLVSSTQLPSTPTRLLTSVMDLNTGEQVYAGTDPTEPSLKDLVRSQPHPYLLLHWVVVGEP